VKSFRLNLWSSTVSLHVQEIESDRLVQKVAPSNRDDRSQGDYCFSVFSVLLQNPHPAQSRPLILCFCTLWSSSHFQLQIQQLLSLPVIEYCTFKALLGVNRIQNQALPRFWGFSKGPPWALAAWPALSVNEYVHNRRPEISVSNSRTQLENFCFVLIGNWN
jgi:hypothetical protein